MVTVKSREDWGARAPKNKVAMDVPSPENYLHHTAGSEAGVSGMHRIQDFHMDSRGWSDIGYSWVYDKDERTWYEGRGWGVQGAHTRGHNDTAHGFCVMGNFQNEAVTKEMIADIAWLVAEGHKAGKCAAELTGGHRDVGSTACPGDNLYNAIPLINNKIDELLNPPAPTEPEEKDWAFPEHAERLLEAGIYSKWTGPGYPIDTDNLSAYLDRLLTKAAGLVRIDGGSAVFQIVGEYLVPVTSPAQAKVIVLTAGGAPSEWQKYVTNITAAQAGEFTKVGSGDFLTSGGAPTEHTHDEYAAKGHGHNYAAPEHTHAPSEHTHELTFKID